jgi:hypothetical protein
VKEPIEHEPVSCVGSGIAMGDRDRFVSDDPGDS